VLWHTPDNRGPYFDRLEDHLRFLHASPPLISRILHIAIGVGFMGFLTKLYKPSEANMLFDGASLVLYMVGITVYIANIVKGLRVVTEGSYDRELVEGEAVAAQAPHVQLSDPGVGPQVIGREDSLRVLAASNTILALVLIGILVLQAGQWYAQKKEELEIAEMDKKADEKKKGGAKKKQ
jgi:hypothetical protein